MAIWEAKEDVGDGADAGFGGGRGELGADAGEGLDRGVEDAGAGPVDGGVAELGAAELAATGEEAHYWAASSHHQLGLTPFVGLDLDPVGNVGVDLRERDRGAVAGDHSDDLRPLGKVLDRRRQGRAGAAPGDDLPVGEADRVALLETALDVVAGGGGDATGGDPRQRGLEPLGVLVGAGHRVELDQGQQARLLGGRGDHPGRLLGELAGALGRHHHVGGAGQHQHLLGRHPVDPGQQLVGGGVERLAAGDDVGAELGEEALEALAGGNRDDAGPPRREPGVALGHLLAHVGDVEVGDRAGALEQGHRRLRRVGVDVDLQRRLVADDEDRVAEALQPRQEVPRGEAAAGDDEVGAVAEAAVLVVGEAAARRLVVSHLGQLVVAAQGGDDPGQNQHQAVAAGVDDAGLAQHLELLRRARHRALAVLDRPF